MTTIQLPATLDAANRKKDRSVSLRLTSMQELSNQEFAVIDTLHGASGWMLFSPEELQEKDIPKDSPPSSKKTPSQRLRAALFVLWEQTSRSQDFESFYKQRMERIIEAVKQEFVD